MAQQFGAVTAAPSQNLAQQFGAQPLQQQASAGTMAQEFGAQQIAAASPSESGIGEIWDWANKPLLSLRRQNAGPIESAVEDAASGLTSPLSLALGVLTLGGDTALEAGAEGAAKLSFGALDAAKVARAAQTVGKLGAIGFTGQQVYGLAKAYPQLQDAIRAGDTDRAKYLLTQGLIQAGTAALGVHGITRGLAEDAAMRGQSEGAARPFLTAGDFSPERQELHRQIVEKLLAGYSRSEQPEALVTAGGVASGKSTAIREAQAANPNLVHIAGDKVKPLLPEFEAAKAAGQLGGRGPLANEAGYVAQQALDEAQRRKLDIAYESTFSGPLDRRREQMQNLLDSGYRVTLAGRHIPEDAAVQLAAERAANSEIPGDAGRSEEESDIRATNRGAARNFLALRGMAHASALDDADGQIMRAVGFGEPKVYDEGKYGAYQQQATRADEGPANTPGAAGGGDLAPGSGAGGARAQGVGGSSQAARGSTEPSQLTAWLQKLYNLPAWTPYKQIIGTHLGALQRSAIETGREVETLRNAVPDAARRSAISRYIEARGSEDILAHRQAEAQGAGLGQLAAEHLAAQSLTPAEKAVADDVRAKFDALLQQGQQAGVLGEGVSDYVPHLWKKLPKDQAQGLLARVGYEAQSGLLDSDLAAAKKRVHGALYEGEMEGLEPQTTDIAQLYGLYRRSLEKAISARGTVAKLFQASAADGRPLVMHSGLAEPVAEEDGSTTATLVRPQTLPGGQLTKAQVANLGKDRLEGMVGSGVVVASKDADGNVSYRWNPSGYRYINSGALRRFKYAGEDTAGKPILLRGDAYVHPEIYEHLKNILSPESFARNGFWRGVLAASTGAKQTLLSLSPFHWLQEGLRAVQSGVNPIGAPEIDLNNPGIGKLLNHGMTLHDINGREDYSEGVASHGGLTARIPVVGDLNNAVSEALFGRFIPRLKAAAALKDVDRLRTRYPKLSEDQVYQAAANKANATFGGLNYKLMGRSASTQDALRLALLAPDWMESQLRFAGGAAGPLGAPYRTDLMRIAAYNFALARAANLAVSGKLHLEQPLGVVSPDGKETYTIRTMPTDIAHMLSDPRSYAYYRLNPLLTRSAMEGLTGRDQGGRMRTGAQQLGDLLKNVVPIPVQGLPGVRANPDESTADAVARAAGFSPAKNRTAAERMAAKFGSERLPSGPASDAEAAQQQLRRNMVDGMREGKLSQQGLLQAVNGGVISPLEARQIAQEARLPPLAYQVSRMLLDQALQVFEAGTEAEKTALRPVIEAKIMRWRQSTARTTTPAARQQEMQNIQAIMGVH